MTPKNYNKYFRIIIFLYLNNTKWGDTIDNTQAQKHYKSFDEAINAQPDIFDKYNELLKQLKQARQDAKRQLKKDGVKIVYASKKTAPEVKRLYYEKYYPLNRDKILQHQREIYALNKQTKTLTSEHVELRTQNTTK